MEIVKFIAPKTSVLTFPDGSRYKGGFGVKSESSNRIYKISFDTAPGAMWWTCSCVGNLTKGMCKHLRACNLRGRAFGRQLQEAKKYGWLT